MFRYMKLVAFVLYINTTLKNITMYSRIVNISFKCRYNLVWKNEPRMVGRSYHVTLNVLYYWSTIFVESLNLKQTNYLLQGSRQDLIASFSLNGSGHHLYPERRCSSRDHNRRW